MIVALTGLFSYLFGLISGFFLFLLVGVICEYGFSWSSSKSFFFQFLLNLGDHLFGLCVRFNASKQTGLINVKTIASLSPPIPITVVI